MMMVFSVMFPVMAMMTMMFVRMMFPDGSGGAGGGSNTADCGSGGRLCPHGTILNGAVVLPAFPIPVGILRGSEWDGKSTGSECRCYQC